MIAATEGVAFLESDVEAYVGWRRPLADPALRPEDTALLVIDMQYGDAHPDYGVMRFRREHGHGEGLEEMARRLDLITGNIRRLQAGFRQRGIAVMFARIRSLTRDGRDRSLVHKELDYHFPTGSRESEILAEVAPVGDELVFSKTTGSVFNSTSIHYVLSNMDIRTLVLVGVMTGGCVESAARDARDLGYRVIVVDDACASYTAEMHACALRVMNEVYAKVKTTDQVLAAVAAPGAK